MNEQTAEEMEREEIEMLLPWYQTGRLTGADAARVEGYLARHPHVAEQLGMIREEQEETVAVNEALGSPSARAIDRLVASLPAAGPRGAPWQTGGLLFRKVADFFTAPTAGAVRWAAVAAAALVVVQAAAITTLVVGDRGARYESAYGPTVGVSAFVVFADQATAPAISRLLAEFDASIVDGPKPGGVYKIRLRTEDRSDAAREGLLRRLAERRDIVRTVLPSSGN